MSTLALFGRTLVLAPHPDDETLGCGGTLLRLRQETASEVHWALMTRMTAEAGYSADAIAQRDREINRVSARYGFEETHQLGFSAALLDSEPTHRLVKAVAGVFDAVEPETLLLPFPNDAHSDHRRTFQIASACAKWFRRGYLRRIMSYEVPSETGFNLDPTAAPFVPSIYIPVPETLIDDKVSILREYAGEMAPFPFPRSEKAIVALARSRGAECGAAAAEAFVLIREVL